MNKARIVSNNEIVSADNLLELYPNYHTLEFVCIDEKCSVPMAPVCIKKNNKKRPHFKKYPNKEHSETCEYAILNELYNIGRNQKLNQTQIKKIGYPSVFDLNEEVSEVKQISQARLDNQDEGVTGRGGIVKIYEFDGENIKFDRSNRVQGIDRIVDWYLGFPYNRDVEIEINGNKIPYRYFFKRIDRNTDPATLNNERIFYGRLRLSETNENVFDKNPDSVIFTLLGFKPKNENTDRIQNYLVKIDKKLVSSIVLSRLKKKYNLLFEKALTEHNNKSAEPSVGLYIFVYGEIDKYNDTTLNVKKHFITFRYDEVRKTMTE